jgi:hypothetical protein
MADTTIKKLGWLAALTLAVGGMAACGEEVVAETGSASHVEASRGSDQRLYNQAAEIAARSTANGSDQRLYNQAAEIAARSTANGSDVHLYNQAAGIAQSQAQPDSSAVAAGSDASPNVWEAGNRAVAAALGR